MSLRKVMSLFFENFVTDRFSIFYSHFTIESFDLAKLKMKMYFYDGVIEQKIAHVVQQLGKFKFRRAKIHRRLLRRFRKVKPLKFLRGRFLRLWRYYDYLLARQIIFFFIYFLNMGGRNMSRVSFINIVRYYYKIFSRQ